MNKIFIEAESVETPEYNFIKTILDKFFQGKQYEIIPMGGVEKLFGDFITNKIKEADIEGSQVLVLIDADTIEKNHGSEERKNWIEEEMKKSNVLFPYFIYPNNGDVEILIESTAQKDLHKTFFNCFEKYEMCISGEIDASGQSKYNTPNRKGKLHTYMTAQKLSNNQRKRLGKGNWMFDNLNYWNLDVENLQPLKDFFTKHLKKTLASVFLFPNHFLQIQNKGNGYEN